MSAIKFLYEPQKASALFQLSTVEGVRRLVEVLAIAQAEGQEGLEKYTAEHRLSVQKVQLADMLLMNLTNSGAGTDWASQEELEEYLRQVEIKAVSRKLMECKEQILAAYLETSEDVVGGLKSLEKVARKLLASLEERGEEDYFKDKADQKVHAVTVKVIDDAWMALQTDHWSAGVKLADYHSLRDVPFEVRVGTASGPDGRMRRRVVDLNDPLFLSTAGQMYHQSPVAPGDHHNYVEGGGDHGSR